MGRWPPGRVLAAIGLLIVLLFVGYEAIERTWLADLDPAALHALHLLRGLSGAAIAVTLTALALLRDPSESGWDTIPAPADDSWKKWIQRFRLRTKLVVPIAGLAVMPPLLIGCMTIPRAYWMLQDGAIERIRFETRVKADAIREFLEQTNQDLRFLSGLRSIRDLSRIGADTDPAEDAKLRRDAEGELLIFGQGHRAYYQVRYLDLPGREVVRIDVAEGAPRAVPRSRLQDKGDRYYVQRARTLEPGRIYVTPMDLNVEHGRVEVPYRGVVRHAMRVVGRNGEEGGLLIINLFADFILRLIGPLPAGSRAWLVSAEGIYLGCVGGSDATRGQYALERRRPLAADHDPATVTSILEARADPSPRGDGTAPGTGRPPEARGSSGFVFRMADTYTSVVPIADPSDHPEPRWRLLVAHPRGPVEAPIRFLMAFLALVTALIAAVASGIGVLVAHYLAGPVARLRDATRQVAAGNLEGRVQIETGDEIEALALDFNQMADRLQEAQTRISSWNADLEREVARQTEQLGLLQRGLARSDKMASIGQMTAGVMHEVGNPLAAIKTMIQVAEEEHLCEDCRVLLAEVVREVDRLATFLRDFSRLARLRDPRFAIVNLSDVIGGVVLLVTPELRRRRIVLMVDSRSEIAPVRGDADQLRQLLINLILNAAEASSTGSEIGVVTRSFVPGTPDDPGVPPASAGAVIVEVIDSGTGISREALEKIGTPFYTTRSDGTGLGLAICRQIVRDHDGTMRISSTIGSGTTVTVTLPVAGDLGAIDADEPPPDMRVGGPGER